MELKDFDTGIKPTWCPGCGNFGIWGALKQALIKSGISLDDTFITYGIGCAGNFADFITGYGYHALHGRAVPPATGAKLANHKLQVFAVAGDGDAYGEGMSHFIHASRRNDDINYVPRGPDSRCFLSFEDWLCSSPL